MGTFFRQLLDEIESYTKKRRNIGQAREAGEPLVDDDPEDKEEKGKEGQSEF